MGVPGFYSWLIKRYPLVKHLIDKQQVPVIDYLYLDMNGIIYKCVKDDSIIFKSQIVPKQMQQIWLDIFNYINMLVNILKPNKMIVMGLDGVAPRAKMNNQRSRRFKSSRDHKKYMQNLQGFTGQTQSSQNFKNNSISPGTLFMEELGNNLQFFIKKKIQEDDYWKSLSVVFTSSSSPGQGQHKIMQFIRANKDNFLPEDTHCLYGADADLIMLSMTLPIQNLCIIREQFVPGEQKVKISECKKQKIVNFEMIFVTIMREYFEIQYGQLRDKMKIPFQLDRVIKDFVFLFFFIGNDFLPRCYAYNIRASSIQDLINAFKTFLIQTDSYVVGAQKLNLKALTQLANAIATRQQKFLTQKQQDFSKLSQTQKQQFDKQLKQQFHKKVVKQQQFINQLKTYYMNDQTNARTLYYGQYFGINPAEKSTQFYQILNYYLYGLQFVYQYYFINLPSWEWFYPYYCAPLVSDLFFYLNYLSENKYELPKIQAGQPFPPFKQLLCILPKESFELVPQPFRKFLLEPDSILRAPIDYYPDKFEEQPYGALKQHEYIALIPYLDMNLINEAYNKAITDVQPQDLRRNQLKPSILFEFDKTSPLITIQSKFKSIPTTFCTISQTKINLRQKISWGKNNPKIKPIQKHLFKMPTLKIRNFFSNQERDKRGKKYYVLELKTDQEVEYKVGEEVFFGYPLEKSGKIQAFLTREKFIFSNKQFYNDNYDLDRLADFRDNKLFKQSPKAAFQIIKNYLIRQYRLQFNWQQINTLLFVKDTQQFVRCLDGNFKRVYTGAQRTRYEIIPTVIASKAKTYQNTMDKINFNSLEEQFGLEERVLVFPQYHKDMDKNKLEVYKGKVVGFNEGKVKVRLGEKIKQIDDKKLSNIVHTREIYFTLKFCAFVLQMKIDVLLTLLQTINIQVNHPELPPSIDIGLNFINRSEQKLVPNLVRINFQQVDPSQNVQKLYRSLDISLKGFELIIEYKKKYPKIIQFIEKRYDRLIENRGTNGKINWRQKITLDEVYGQQEYNADKAVKSLMSLYLWLIKKQQTSMPLSSIYSKQISVKNIKKLQQEFTHLNNIQKQKKHKYGDPKIVQVDPNYLFSRRLATYGKIHLHRAPQSSTIRDQVICLHPEFFGELGVIIGFDFNKFQVMFSKPSFGKSDLNGICDNLWAGKFYERDLFNFATWPDIMVPRRKTNNLAQNIGWDGSFQTKNVPKFQQKALKQFADIQKLNQKKNIFSAQFLQYIRSIKDKRKVQKIDQEYQVVDNRKGQYTYKYDKGKASISNQFVDNVAKDKKYIEKPIESSMIKREDIQKEIIQNKVEEPVKKEVKVEGEGEGETKVQAQDEEDDVDDMIK